MTHPKHERLTELMTDAMWCADNAHRSITDPERMVPVVAVIQQLLRSQARIEDYDGCLGWTADWLDTHLVEDAE
jgi:hypothetical protein